MYAWLLRPLAARVAVVAALVSIAPSLVLGQTNTTGSSTLGIAPGARVRVTGSADSALRQTGTIVAIDGDRLVLRRDAANDSVALPFSGVSKLELSRGRHGHAIRGLAVGLISGAAVGAITFAVSDSRPRCPPANGGWDFCGFNIVSPGALAGGAVLLGGLSGGLLGTVIGSFIHSEQWHTVSVDRLVVHPQARIAVIPSPSGPRLALALSARF